MIPTFENVLTFFIVMRGKARVRKKSAKLDRPERGLEGKNNCTWPTAQSMRAHSASESAVRSGSDNETVWWLCVASMYMCSSKRQARIEADVR